MDKPDSSMNQQIADAAAELFANASETLLREIKRITGVEVREASSEIDPARRPQASMLPAEAENKVVRAVRKGRTNRQIAELLIAVHLKGRPHDTAADVARAVGCSTGLVAESAVWILNQQRLRIAKKQRIDPIGIKLNEHAVNAAGANPMTQLHDHQEQTRVADGKIDEKEKVLFNKIGDYQKQHLDATVQETAAALECTAGDVERRQAIINRLTTQQADSRREDIVELDDTAKNGKRQKWVEKRP